MKDILIVGDVHFNYEHQPTLNKIYKAIEERQPSVVVQIGDLYDMFSASSFVRPVIRTLAQELDEAKPKAIRFWEIIRDAVPRATLYQLRGNHDIRPLLRLREKAPELEYFYDDRDLWKFKGVKTIYDSRQELVIGDIVFVHGYRTKLGDHAKYMQRKIVCGHSHQGGVMYMNTFNGQIWELNVGFCADPLSTGFTYMKQKFTKWTQGYGYIDKYGPRFCPL